MFKNHNQRGCTGYFEIWGNPIVNKYLWEPLYNNVDEVRDVIPDNYSGPNLALV